jgi:hypothetical protein
MSTAVRTANSIEVLNVPVVPVVRKIEKKIYSCRNGQIRSTSVVSENEINQLKYDGLPRDVEPLPKSRIYHLGNNTPLKEKNRLGWRTVKIVEKPQALNSYERPEPRFRLYSIVRRSNPRPIVIKPKAQKPPQPPPPKPKFRIYAIEKDFYDINHIRNENNRMQRQEYPVRSQPVRSEPPLSAQDKEEDEIESIDPEQDHILETEQTKF